MSSYQPGIPTGTVNLDVDYQNLQNNFQQLDTTFGIDHTTFSNQTAQNGYHRTVHLIPVSTILTNPPNNQPVVSPVTVAGIGEVFSAQINDGVNTDEALYFKTGGGRVMQLTRNFVPVASNNGYTFLPGGLILQWGRVNSTSSGTVTFSSANIAFPNNCFEVITQPFYTGATPNGTATVAVRLNTNVSFTWSFISNSGSYNGFFWAAIGN